MLNEMFNDWSNTCCTDGFCCHEQFNFSHLQRDATSHCVWNEVTAVCALTYFIITYSYILLDQLCTSVHLCTAVIRQEHRHIKNKLKSLSYIHVAFQPFEGKHNKFKSSNQSACWIYFSLINRRVKIIL